MLLDVLDSGSRPEGLVNSLIEQGGHLGWTLIKAVIVFTVGRFVIRLINRIVRRVLERHDFEPSLKTFIGSLVNVTLMVLLIISVVGALGVQTTSFAALLASAGVAVGMALSGNLSNFAGGLLILLFKPFKVGDYIVAQGTEGTVREIQIFYPRSFAGRGKPSAGTTFPERRTGTCGVGTIFLIGVAVTRRAGTIFLIGVAVTRRDNATFLIGVTVAHCAGMTFPENAPVTNFGEHAAAMAEQFFVRGRSRHIKNRHH